MNWLFSLATKIIAIAIIFILALGMMVSGAFTIEAIKEGSYISAIILGAIALFFFGLGTLVMSLVM